MNIKAFKNNLSGSITVPGSKSHTIRALILASLAEGKSYIRNPLPSADCLSTAKAVPLIGADINLNLSEESQPGTCWEVTGAGKNIHIPTDVVDVGNSGSLLYFLSPILANLDGWSVFTGDNSLKSRPITHVVDALNQLGAFSETTVPNHNGCPFVVKGPIKPGVVSTPGEVSSQYISGLMMSGILLNGELLIKLSNPKETPYLTMTQNWLEKVGVPVWISDDFKEIKVKGPVQINAFDEVIPSDWEAVAFPLIAAILTDSEIVIENIDGSGTQGDDAIVDILKSIGAEITWDKENCKLFVKGGKKTSDKIGRLSTENCNDKTLKVKMSSFPDAICALAVVACFTEGTTILEDAEVCRRKETDRIKVLKTELSKLGADIEETEDSLIIHGHSPLNADGSENKNFILHGGTVESYDDHRMAMSLSCLGLALPKNEELLIKDAECCSVSFPKFYEVMNNIGANFI